MFVGQKGLKHGIIIRKRVSQTDFKLLIFLELIETDANRLMAFTLTLYKGTTILKGLMVFLSQVPRQHALVIILQFMMPIQSVSYRLSPLCYLAVVQLIAIFVDATITEWSLLLEPYYGINLVSPKTKVAKAFM